MNHNKIQKDSERFIIETNKDYATFLETGCDYPEEMRQRDMKAVRQSELASLACLFAAGVMAGLVLAVVFGV